MLRDSWLLTLPSQSSCCAAILISDNRDGVNFLARSGKILILCHQCNVKSTLLDYRREGQEELGQLLVFIHPCSCPTTGKHGLHLPGFWSITSAIKAAHIGLGFQKIKGTGFQI